MRTLDEILNDIDLYKEYIKYRHKSISKHFENAFKNHASNNNSWSLLKQYGGSLDKYSKTLSFEEWKCSFPDKIMLWFVNQGKLTTMKLRKTKDISEYKEFYGANVLMATEFHETRCGLKIKLKTVISEEMANYIHKTYNTPYIY